MLTRPKQRTVCSELIILWVHWLLIEINAFPEKKKDISAHDSLYLPSVAQAPARLHRVRSCVRLHPDVSV